MEINNNFIKPVTKEGIKKMFEQMSNCICKVKNNQIIGTGFFCIIKLDNNVKIKALISNYQVINEQYITSNNKITLLLGDNNVTKIINLVPNRLIYFNKEYNITIIELKSNDNINTFLELDYNIFSNNLKTLFERESIYILHHLTNGKVLASYGIINKLNGFNINHMNCLGPVPNGSPIFNLTNNKLIGISLNLNHNINSHSGFIVKYPIEKFVNKYQNRINQINNRINNNNFQIPIHIRNNSNNMNFKPAIQSAFNNNSNPNLNNINNAQNNPSFKIDIIFRLTNGKKYIIAVNRGTTVDQLLKKFYEKIGRLDLYREKSQKFIFSFNASGIKYGEQTPVEKYFINCAIPIISVVETINVGPFMSIMFRTNNGITHIVKFEINKTIGDLLKEYLCIAKRPDLIGDKTNTICFQYNARSLKYGDKTKLSQFFNNDKSNFKIINVIDQYELIKQDDRDGYI